MWICPIWGRPSWPAGSASMGIFPIVLVSAHLFPSDSAALKDLPTLPLPFSRRQLLEVLDRAIGGKAA